MNNKSKYYECSEGFIRRIKNNKAYYFNYDLNVWQKSIWLPIEIIKCPYDGFKLISRNKARKLFPKAF
jgi:hypothetical protein